MRTTSTSARLVASLLLLLSPLLATGCGEDEPSIDEAGGRPEEILDVSSPTFGIVNILRASGNDVTVVRRTERPVLEKGWRMLVNQGIPLEIYEFDNSDERKQAEAKITGGGDVLGGKDAGWEGTPHFFRTDKVLMVYVGDDQENVDALAGWFGEPITIRR